MTKTITLPLPSDVDVSDMPHLPLLDRRLMGSRSWLKAKNYRGSGPGLGFCLMNLWVAAFRAVPAGSLDGDDDSLAEAARCDIAYWLEIKDLALAGWRRIGDRVWHPVVSELAWDLWVARLKARHDNAFNSWRAAAKRCTDKGREPPDPPGTIAEWMAAKYPASAAYVATVAAGDAPYRETGPDENTAHTDTGPVGNVTHFEPKRSEAKVITPHYPPTPPPADGPMAGKGGGNQPRTGTGRDWFKGEFGRLQRTFGDMVPVMMAYLQRPGTSAKFVFVETFKGAWLDPGGGKGEILMPTKARADALQVEHGEWLRMHWPDLRIRHASTDEKRAFKRRLTA